MHNVCLLGAGQLGSRHLQSLLKTEIPLAIDVYDPSPASIATSRERAAQIPHSGAKVPSLRFFTDFQQLGREYDLAILSSTAEHRLGNVEQLLQQAKVRNWVLEKIAFPSIPEFEKCLGLLAGQGAWVNCARRMYPDFQILKQELFPSAQPLSCIVAGGELGLFCNSIHYLDHLSWLCGQSEFFADISGLRPGLIPSKRPGFFEASGTLRFSGREGSELLIREQPKAPAGASFQILGEAARVLVDESGGRMCIYSGKSSEERPFRAWYQSELTHLLAREILEKGSCPLPTLRESFPIHRALLDGVQRHLDLCGHPVGQRLPIT